MPEHAIESPAESVPTGQPPAGGIVTGTTSEALRLDLAVARLSGWTRRQSQRAIVDGQVYVEGRRCREPGQQVAQAATLVVHPTPPDRTDLDGGGVRVVLEDEDWLVLNKPAGLPCQPEPGGGDALSLRAAQHLGRPVADVHRLDREVSGLVLWGKHPGATRHAAALFHDHLADRRYLALVRGQYLPDYERISAPIGEDDRGLPTIAATGRPAVSHALVLHRAHAQRMALLAVMLETGRSHQIRLHLAYALGAVVGDVRHGDLPGHQYGDPPRIALHAASLRWQGLRGEPLLAHCPPPDDFWPPGSDASWLAVDWLAQLRQSL